MPVQAHLAITTHATKSIFAQVLLTKIRFIREVFMLSYLPLSARNLVTGRLHIALGVEASEAEISEEVIF